MPTSNPLFGFSNEFSGVGGAGKLEAISAGLLAQAAARQKAATKKLLWGNTRADGQVSKWQLGDARYRHAVQANRVQASQAAHAKKTGKQQPMTYTQAQYIARMRNKKGW